MNKHIFYTLDYYLVVESIAEGSKVQAEIIIFPQHVKHLKEG